MGEFIPATCLACKHQIYGTEFRISNEDVPKDQLRHFCQHPTFPKDREIEVTELADRPKWCPITGK